jgi:urease accessory protein
LELDRPDRLNPVALAAYGGGWAARLEARVARVAQRSTLARVSHRGPLRLQKALWPEGPDPVHLILLHPPGGIAGGDTLELALDIEAGAQALVTTPGAGKWYRADAPARQSVSLQVADGAALEWLPQETIVHDGAIADSVTTVSLGAGASAIGWEVTVLGRRAFGERFEAGEVRQSLCIECDGEVLFDEHAWIRGADAAQPVALGEHHVAGLMWAVSAVGFDDEAAASVESETEPAGAALVGASRLAPRLLLVRAVGSSPQQVRGALAAAWRCLRPAIFGRPAREPRIWTT